MPANASRGTGEGMVASLPLPYGGTFSPSSSESVLISIDPTDQTVASLADAKGDMAETGSSSGAGSSAGSTTIGVGLGIGAGAGTFLNHAFFTMTGGAVASALVCCFPPFFPVEALRLTPSAFPPLPFTLPETALVGGSEGRLLPVVPRPRRPSFCFSTLVAPVLRSFSLDLTLI